MAIQDILSTAHSGLGAAQLGLRTVASNIANADVPGHARQRVNTSTAVTAGRITGVATSAATRVADAWLDGQMFARSGDAAAASETARIADRLQADWGTPGDPSSLTGRIDALAAAAVRLTAPESGAGFARDVIDRAQDVIAGVTAMRDGVDALHREVSAGVGSTTARINVLLGQVHDANGAVARLKAQGQASAGPESQRHSALAELAGLIGITTSTQSDGRIFVTAQGGAALVDARLRQIAPAGDTAAIGAGDLSADRPATTLDLIGPDGNVLRRDPWSPAGAGGTLGALIGARDGQLPVAAFELHRVLSTVMQALNKASNAATAVPPPSQLAGRATGLEGSDRLGFAGQITVSRVDAGGRLLAAATLNLSAVATIDDMVGAINASGAGITAALDAQGALSLSAAPGSGVVVGAGSPAATRAGVGFAHFFGLNDMVRAPGDPLVPVALRASDAHGLAPSAGATLIARSAAGAELGRVRLDGSAGPTLGDLVGALDAGPLGRFGSFALDERGHLVAPPGVQLIATADTSERGATGVRLTQLLGLDADGGALREAAVVPALAADPARLPLARMIEGAALGAAVLGPGNRTGAAGFAAALGDTGADGISVTGTVADIAARTTARASTAQARADDMAARSTDATARRDAFSGVNVDEELALMVTLQASYAASARVMKSASDMLDTLIAMVR